MTLLVCPFTMLAGTSSLGFIVQVHEKVGNIRGLTVDIKIEALFRTESKKTMTDKLIRLNKRYIADIF